MSYTLPEFNLTMKYAIDGTQQPQNVVTWYGPYNCQKYLPSRPVLNQSAFVWWWGYFVPLFRVDPATFLAYWGDDPDGWDPAYIECPDGSGQYYRVFAFEMMHQGFPNQYPVFASVRCSGDSNPLLIPMTANNIPANPAVTPLNMGPIP